jgi:hypothetical protein
MISIDQQKTLNRRSAGVYGNFYLYSIKHLSKPRLRSHARSLRGEGLLTKNGRRPSMLEEKLLKRFKIERDSLRILEHARLVRREQRQGALYYEISHDRIAEAIHYTIALYDSQAICVGLLGMSVAARVQTPECGCFMQCTSQVNREIEILPITVSQWLSW